jgi:hypothetical protein
VRINGPLRGNRCRQGISCTREGGEECIPLRIHLLTASFLKSCTDESPVIVQYIGVPITQGLEEARGPLDVGEEEGDCPRGQVLQERPPRHQWGRKQSDDTFGGNGLPSSDAT